MLNSLPPYHKIWLSMHHKDSMNKNTGKDMSSQDWENVYGTKGIVQNDVLFTVGLAANLMSQNKSKNVLDLACGTGRHVLYLSSKGFNVYGLDISKTAIDITRTRISTLGLKNVFLGVGDMHNLEFSDNFFDAVLCVWSSCHGLKKDVKKLVDEMIRVVRKGGLICSDFMSVEDKDFMKGKCIEENTFLHDHLDHPNVPHHYSTLDELTEFFSACEQKKISPITYEDPAFNSTIGSFWVEAYK